MSESHAADGPYDVPMRPPLLDPRTCTHPEDQLDHSGPWNKDRLTCKACGAPVRWDSRPRLVLVHPEMMVAQAPPIQASTPEHVALHAIAQALKVSGQAAEVGMLAVKVIQERDRLTTEYASIKAYYDDAKGEAAEARAELEEVKVALAAVAAKEPTRAYAEGILHDIQMALGLTNDVPRSELATKARQAMERGDQHWSTINDIAAALGLTTWRADELPVVARDLKAASAQPPRRWNAGSLVQRLMSDYPGNPSPSVIARALVLLGAIDS
jgi:hypothetical protein